MLGVGVAGYDGLMVLSRTAKQGFCGFELKPPSIPADDPTLLENAAAKARGAAHRKDSMVQVKWVF